MRVLRLWLTKIGEEIGLPICWLLLVLLITCLPVRYVLAQDPNNNYCANPQGAETGGFTLNKTRICVGGAVTIVSGSVPTNLANVGYVSQYSGKGIPSNFEAGPSFTYTRPGSYTILQVGSRNNSRALACQTLTVLPLDPISLTVKSCSGRKVTVVPDISTLGQYDTYVINWNDGNIQEVNRAGMEANPEHTYTDNGADTRTVTVEGVYGTSADPICKTPFTQTIKLLPVVAQPAITTLKTVSDNSISITYQAGAGAVVQLHRKINGVYTDTGLKESAPGTFNVQTDAKQVQCFQVVAQDVCNSSGIRSDEVCSLALDAKAGNKKNTLNWQPYAGTTGQFRSYRITRNGASIGGTITNQNTATYTDDNSIVCGTQYCYSLAATVAGSVTQTEITSASVCVTGVNGDVPDNLNDVVVTVENNRPKLVATFPNSSSGTLSSYTLAIGRSNGSSGAFTPVGTVLNNNTFVDNNVSASAGSYCYQITYQGVCGLTLPPSQPVCTVFLNSETRNSIDWTRESPFTPDPVAAYTLIVTDSLNGATQRISMGTGTRYEINPNDANASTFTYQIIATAGSKTSYSNFVTLYRDSKIWTPDAFTPNGDRINDEFLPRGIANDRFLMTIYGRWGEIVYSTTDKTKGWNGLINGAPASVGQYMYRIEIEDPGGQKTVRTGAVLLLR
ncbi:T9SS type B sorting domain-containing protein [Spirosoma validum]|uniref:Gliding motility-associated C-terminal domain-containing protein n=1 Tax=Spirosoma validum TaxID=2771355 RepID=A0A927GC00_9BACT|nr:gliding motility-associated C-terminal domain-containing protein [Spirosoma validum]MBD2752242.1 gliding motility-associated C-terminal domain-containing protein [Spirosoma validum]